MWSKGFPLKEPRYSFVLAAKTSKSIPPFSRVTHGCGWGMAARSADDGGAFPRDRREYFTKDLTSNNTVDGDTLNG